jgi:hypothetical protein
MQFSLKIAQSAKQTQKFQLNYQKFRSGVTLLGKTPPMEISSQKTLLNNFSPVQRILTCNTPIDSARQVKTHRKFICFSKFYFRGATGEFLSKNTLLNNFLNVRPIFTNSILIDSTQQGEQNEIIKNFNSRGVSGEFSRKNTPG